MFLEVIWLAVFVNLWKEARGLRDHGGTGVLFLWGKERGSPSLGWKIEE